jgi:hypothetical protein
VIKGRKTLARIGIVDLQVSRFVRLRADAHRSHSKMAEPLDRLRLKQAVCQLKTGLKKIV